MKYSKCTLTNLLQILIKLNFLIKVSEKTQINLILSLEYKMYKF